FLIACAQVAGGAAQPEYIAAKPKNDIHVRNVYYAERPADQPGASEHAGRMSFVGAKAMLCLPHRAGEIFQLMVEAAASRRGFRSRSPSPGRRAHAQTTRHEDNLQQAKSKFCVLSPGSAHRSSAASDGWFRIAPSPTRCQPMPSAAESA